MTTLIMGAGAMGSLFAARFARAALPISLYDPDQVKINAIRARGLELEEEGASRRFTQVAAYGCLADCPPPARVLLLVKSYHIADAAADLAQRGFGHLPLLSLQNGIGHGQLLTRLLPHSRLCLGVTYLAALLLAPGRTKATGQGCTVIAPENGLPLAEAESWAALLNAAGCPAQAQAEVSQLQWQKLAVNAVINPLTTLLQVDNGSLLNWPEFSERLARLVTETTAVARAEGIALDSAQLAEQVRHTCAATARNHSSMLSDIEQGRRTEIEAINGMICRLGAVHGVATPEHCRLYQAVYALEQG